MRELTLGLHGLSEASCGRGHEGGDATRAGKTRRSEQHGELLGRREVEMEENCDEETISGTFTLAHPGTVCGRLHGGATRLQRYHFSTSSTKRDKVSR